jgi:SAM-dependent methyltransferase
MKSDTVHLRELLTGMRAAYARGENAMAHARRVLGTTENSPVATLVAYDLQAGSYVAGVRANPDANERWCGQLAEVLAPWVDATTSLLEVGCGEATTLAGIVQRLPRSPRKVLGFDISWSRCAEGLRWLESQSVTAQLFVADLFEIPLANEAIDIVYTSHSLEPNGGKEEAALSELLRVARRAVVLVEPLYELAGEPARKRMEQHGYVRGLRAAAEKLGAQVRACRLLDYTGNPLNPSGLIILEKAPSSAPSAASIEWRCPLTHTPLRYLGDACVAAEAAVAYPVLRDIPLLRAEHAIVAAGLCAVGTRVSAGHGVSSSAATHTLSQ